MALTLLDAITFKGGATKMEAGIIKMFAQKSPVMETIPFVKIDGSAYIYAKETALPGIGWRGINEPWSESTGTINPEVERLYILGGEVKIDQFLLKTQISRGADLKTQQYAMKVQAMMNEWDRAFFEGDDQVDTKEMVGLRRRLSGNQVMLMNNNTDGDTLTIAALQQLLDLVPFDNKVLFMNRTLRRKITTLVNAATGSVQIQWQPDQFGRQQMQFAGVPIRIMERMGDASTILDFDEDPGAGAADTASIYCVAFGEETVHGIYNNGGEGKLVNVRDFGEQEDEPRTMGRIEGYYGIVTKHPRGAARLRGINNA